MASIVQAHLGGNSSQTVGPSSTVTTCTSTYPSPTTSGNLLIACCFYTIDQATGISLPSRSVTFTDSGGNTWSNSVNGGGYTTASTERAASMFLLGNCPVVSSNTLTFSLTLGATSASTYAVKMETVLFEVAGCVASTNYSGHGPLVDNSKGAASTTSTPTVSGLVLASNDVVFFTYIGNSGNVGAGAGYTLGPSTTVAVTGQVEYNLNVTAGTVSAAYAATQAQWGGSAIGFIQAAAATATSSYGFFFG
jgi:hypothetical protein